MHQKMCNLHALKSLFKMKKSIILLFVLAACGQVADTQEVLQAGLSSKVQTAENELFFSKKQIELSDIALVDVSEKIIQESINSAGVLGIPPENKASISCSVGGFIKYSDKIVGDFVKKGEVLAILEHPDYIKLQQDFLETKSQISFLEKDFERQKSMQTENIGAAKDFQRSESEYQSAKVRLAALASQLKMLGISPERLSIQTLSSTVQIFSPIEGYVSEVFTEIGKFVSPQDVLMRVIDKSHLHLELQVFEKDIFKVKNGQKVHFKVKEWNESFEAHVKQISQNFETATRSVNVHAHLDNIDSRFKVGMFIEAQIAVGEQKNLCVPEEAICESEGKFYVFVPKKDTEKGTFYERLEVQKGSSSDSWTVVGGLKINQKVVGKGAYYLEATYQKNNSSEE